MSNEVKRFSPEYCEAGGVGWAEMQEDAEGAWCKASDYDALAAEFKELAERYAKLQTGEDGLVSRVVAERDAALAELAAIRAAGGGDLHDHSWTIEGLDEQIRVVRLSDAQRIVAAMAAELERAKEEVTRWHTLACNHSRAEDRLRAELEAARKQEPVAYVLFRDGEVCYESDDSIVISNTPGDETDLYKWLPVFTIPPLAGKVGVPTRHPEHGGVICQPTT